MTNLSIGQATLSTFASTASRPYTRADLATTVPDYGVVGLIPSNDIAGTAESASGGTVTTNLGTMKTAYATVLAQLAALGITRVYGCTVAPRTFAINGARESQRLQFNAWLRGLPLGLAGLIDADLILRDPQVPSRIAAELVATDNVHPLAAGHQRLAQSIRIGRKAA